MSDLESGLKEAIEGARGNMYVEGRGNPNVARSRGNGGAAKEDLFPRIRAVTRGALIGAHTQLNADIWTEADDAMLDMVTAWLDNVRARS